MRYLFGFLCVCALVGASPLSASAQGDEEGTTAEPSLEAPAYGCTSNARSARHRATTGTRV